MISNVFHTSGDLSSSLYRSSSPILLTLYTAYLLLSNATIWLTTMNNHISLRPLCPGTHIHSTHDCNFIDSILSLHLYYLCLELILCTCTSLRTTPALHPSPLTSFRQPEYTPSAALLVIALHLVVAAVLGIIILIVAATRVFPFKHNKTTIDQLVPSHPPFHTSSSIIPSIEKPQNHHLPTPYVALRSS